MVLHFCNISCTSDMRQQFTSLLAHQIVVRFEARKSTQGQSKTRILCDDALLLEMIWQKIFCGRDTFFSDLPFYYGSYNGPQAYKVSFTTLIQPVFPGTTSKGTWIRNCLKFYLHLSG